MDKIVNYKEETVIIQNGTHQLYGILTVPEDFPSSGTAIRKNRSQGLLSRAPQLIGLESDATATAERLTKEPLAWGIAIPCAIPAGFCSIFSLICSGATLI